MNKTELINEILNMSSIHYNYTRGWLRNENIQFLKLIYDIECLRQEMYRDDTINGWNILDTKYTKKLKSLVKCYEEKL